MHLLLNVWNTILFNIKLVLTNIVFVDCWQILFNELKFGNSQALINQQFFKACLRLIYYKSEKLMSVKYVFIEIYKLIIV